MPTQEPKKSYKFFAPKVFIRTFGCQMNVRDSEVIRGLLGKAGYKFTEDEKKADVVIFNTCSVRQHAEEKVWSAIGRIVKQSSPPSFASAKLSGGTTSPQGRKKIIGLVGCMAQNYKEEIFKRATAVDFVVGPSDIDKIPEIISKIQKRDCFAPAALLRKAKQQGLAMTGDLKIWQTDGLERPDEIYHTGFYEDKNHAYVVISEGCSTHCSYCVVPFVRGELHNRDRDAVLREVGEAVDRGISKVTLLGQNVNSYKFQITNSKFQTNSKSQIPNSRTQVDFIDLLKAINEIKGLKEFTFITSHPKDTSPELFKTMAECDKLKKNLHLPVQSGSDRILKLMNRGYTSQQYLALVENYKKIIPGGTLTTDIIVGFPTESEEDFLETYELMKRVKFDAAYIFKYSPRPNTEAEKLPDDVPREEKERRHKLLLDFQKKLHYENSDAHR